MNARTQFLVTILLIGLSSSSAAAWDPLQSAERAAAAGQRALAEGDTTLALQHLLRAQALAPENEEIRMGLGEALYTGGEFDGARKQFEPIGRDEGSERRRQALYNAGNAAFLGGDLPQALGLYAEALSASDAPADEDLLYNLELTQKLLEQQQQDQQQGDQSGQQQQEQQQEQQQGDQNDQQQEQEQQQQEQQESEQQNDGEDGSEGQEQQPPEQEQEEAAPDSTGLSPEELDQMTPEEAMRLLQALDFDEEELRKSIQRRLRGDDKESEHDW